MFETSACHHNYLYCLLTAFRRLLLARLISKKMSPRSLPTWSSFSTRTPMRMAMIAQPRLPLRTPLLPRRWVNSRLRGPRMSSLNQNLLKTPLLSLQPPRGHPRPWNQLRLYSSTQKSISSGTNTTFNLWPNHWNSAPFVASLKLVYEETLENDRPLKDLAVKTAAKHAKELTDRGEFASLCKENAEITFDVLKASLIRLCRRCETADYVNRHTFAGINYCNNCGCSHYVTNPYYCRLCCKYFC
jgi:hypothetical protein